MLPFLLNADGETRTRKAYATRPSNVRVYQFHHIRMIPGKYNASIANVFYSPVTKRQRNMPLTANIIMEVFKSIYRTK